LRSWIEPELAGRLSEVLEATAAQVVLISDWRQGRELDELRANLAAAGVNGTLLSVTPVLGPPRWQEIEAWLAAHATAPDAFVIVDDAFDMGPFASRFVRTSPLNGLDLEAANAILALFGLQPDGTPMSGTRILYRPVGPKELALIAESGYREFPPRLPEQPIFYPVTNEEYARHIAEQWNVNESSSGYVTRFAVREAFIARYAVQQVGARLHTEHWIPAEDLPEFNRNIVGLIEVIASFEEKS
jgi:HAD domain in Swiss Army Knife RNA repair proteins